MRISINFTLDHPEMVERVVLVGAVVGGMPYTKHFLERGDALGKPLEKGDIEGAIAAATKDKYLTAPGSDAARKQMAEILSANPQDLTHPDLELPVKPALPQLGEIRIPILLLVGDADIPDVHAHAGAIEAGVPRKITAVPRRSLNLFDPLHGATTVPMNESKRLTQNRSPDVAAPIVEGWPAVMEHRQHRSAQVSLMAEGFSVTAAWRTRPSLV